MEKIKEELSLFSVSLEFKRPDTKHSILYVADPVCAWCYGFSPVFEKIREKYSDKIEFTLVLGGLKYGPEAENFTEEVTEKLKYLWKEVERISKRNFHYDILQDRNIRYDSEPGSRAVITAQRINPSLSFSFLDKLLESFHSKGKDPSSFETYAEIASELSFPLDEFKELYYREETLLETRNDFNYGYILGVTGFPCLVFSDGLDRGILTKGYSSFEEVDALLGDYFRSIGQY
ncbi:DSBA-like thioredoxin domain protein [Leptospira licerasiae serovar Varillal str. VAR 010]|uniref:DSBA-like thioredoxin domain protein n=1 Tax=Leptospira licerasiae str. MMD4847 TaxID=1049971 RepID=A0ABP2RC43_9LEPT|nr:DSBA-like thioredoxin domain protein [Leptospira licerasiae serovar Varillal str. VAR 010]EJZ40929.1 DSBA-like thioredoxin domain protein [Leptospira licerasiae str. MMD4847]